MPPPSSSLTAESTTALMDSEQTQNKEQPIQLGRHHEDKAGTHTENKVVKATSF